jgi:pimeloyl-ACP methyl ester carboxylesterase/class 3 adenylate cyclase
MAPHTRYAKSGDVSIAYQVVGDGAIDLVVVPGFVSHVEIAWENPSIVRLVDQLSRFARVIIFDKRGTGMSDPVEDVPTLEQRMDDVRAVMDAAGSQQAALLGFSEGGPMCILFAATYPERTRALVLSGAMARSTWAEDYPWATPAPALIESAREFTLPSWGTGDGIEVFAPSLADDPKVREWWGRMERVGASPSMVRKLFLMFLETDVREALPLVQAPTLVIHRHGDRVVNVGAGRYLAEHIQGARFLELPGQDHIGWGGNTESFAGEIEEFITGARAQPVEEFDRVLATVLFTDIVGSTEKTAELGDRRWREKLMDYYAMIRRELERFHGREVKTTGDGLFASFDGPARAIACAQSIVVGGKALGLELRTGLHTGECEVLGDDVGGIAVHTGARIMALAEPGEVLVSSTVKDLVAGSRIGFADRDTHTLKGVPGEWRLFAVMDPTSA